MADKPNLLYVFADQMRVSALGCTPSRGSLLTGRHALTAR